MNSLPDTDSLITVTKRVLLAGLEQIEKQFEYSLADYRQ